MNLDSVSDRISEEDLRRTNSGFENYVLDLKARSTKRGYPESELLVLHLEESKRPHSAIPLQITKIEMEKESKQHYFQKKYPLLARTNDIFSKCITKIPASPQMSSRNNSTTDVRPESCLSGGDASCREKATEISDETVAGDMANHLQINVEQKQQEQIKSVRPKSSQDYPELKNYLQIVRGEKWLANGRNLFEERKQNNSKRFNDLPGSKQTWEFTKTPPHSFNFKCHTPSPTYKSTRPNSSYTPSKKSTLNTISAVPLNIQQYANSSPNKKILQKQRAWSANMCFEKKREKRDYRDQEDRKYNCKFAHNPNNLCLENQRLEFSSVPPSCLQHTPKTPIPSPTNLRKK